MRVSPNSLRRGRDKIQFPMRILSALLLAVSCLTAAGVTFEGKQGPGKGKHIVLVSGDEEYRSEEMLPQLARILAERHGFKCTVLFAIDRKDGTVNPNQNDNIPGLEALDSADLMVLFIRWRDLPDDQTAHFERFVRTGKPIVAMRTATHPFNFKTHPTYAKWSSNSKEWDGGFGRQLLGETWISHHGQHKVQSTRAVPAPGKRSHPILRGIERIWGPTDVYTTRQPFPPENDVILLGEVLSGMNPTDPPVTGEKNSPMMPVAWTRTYKYQDGKAGRAFTTTMGSAKDFEDESYRRLIVNATYWGLGMEKKITPKLDVSLVGSYSPTMFGFDGFRKGLRPEDF